MCQVKIDIKLFIDMLFFNLSLLCFIWSTRQQFNTLCVCVCEDNCNFTTLFFLSRTTVLNVFKETLFIFSSFCAVGMKLRN